MTRTIHGSSPDNLGSTTSRGETDNEMDVSYVYDIGDGNADGLDMTRDDDGRNDVEGDIDGLDEVKGDIDGLDEVKGDADGLDEVVGDIDGLDEVIGDADGLDEAIGDADGLDEVIGDAEGLDVDGDAEAEPEADGLSLGPGRLMMDDMSRLKERPLELLGGDSVMTRGRMPGL
ncbi:hypothetical protein CVT25_005542 [Psilocybe cyanescens]|uniref:Uncharacterized protein n=1 Tax=Psilocybe cyanescens TaxID=93625 RepID=A0A409VQS9_PSICY|nr:hypothetical protein CVT25_005542 [Psilocybe cyanescens]